MKPLTTEEKAKLYEEAIEQAKKELATCGDMNCDAARQIFRLFPELKESEDERIRKRITHALHGDVLELSEIKEAITWLEKQGTPAKLSEEEQNRFAKGVLTSCAMSFIDYLDAHKYEGKMCVSNGECEDIENAFHNAMWDRLHRYYCKYIERQGETKHVEWSEEDKDMLRMLLEMINYASDHYQHDDKATDIKAWVLKSLKDRVGCEMNCTTTKEWSEEDESKIRHLIAFLDTNPNSVIYSRPKEEWINWLKSLRPQSTWKPSDEQMEAMNTLIINIVRNPLLLDNFTQANLKTLYDDLKKLREE